MAAPKTIIIEGIIGAGKSSLGFYLHDRLERFGPYPNSLYLTEPDEKTNPYLADYYADPDRWAFPMQIHLLQERYRMHLQAQWHVLSRAGHAVLDRSYFGDVAFAYLQRELGHLSEREFETYKKLYQTMTANVLFPNVCVLLMVDTKVAQERIRKRITEKTGRACEEVISASYLESLQKEIYQAIELLERQGTTIYRVPWNEWLPPDEEPYHLKVEQIANWIEELELHSAFPDFHRRLT